MLCELSREVCVAFCFVSDVSVCVCKFTFFGAIWDLVCLELGDCCSELCRVLFSVFFSLLCFQDITWHVIDFVNCPFSELGFAAIFFGVCGDSTNLFSASRLFNCWRLLVLLVLVASSPGFAVLLLGHIPDYTSVVWISLISDLFQK